MNKLERQTLSRDHYINSIPTNTAFVLLATMGPLESSFDDLPHQLRRKA
jgi:hypothetical protein